MSDSPWATNDTTGSVVCSTVTPVSSSPPVTYGSTVALGMLALLFYFLLFLGARKGQQSRPHSSFVAVVVLHAGVWLGICVSGMVGLEVRQPSRGFE